MAVPTLTPASTVGATVLPITGSKSNVVNLPFGVYSLDTEEANSLYDPAFVSGAVAQVAYVYKKLGGDVLDVELTEGQVYTAYEESTLEYSYIINIHQAKNSLSDVLGSTTGTFDHTGSITSGTDISLKYPKYRFTYATERIGNAVSTEAGIGGTDSIYSASFAVTQGIQDYDLQNIISGSAVADTALPYASEFIQSSSLGNPNPAANNKKITVRRVFYKTNQAMWRFFGYFGGINVMGNMSTFGQYADDSTFQVVPVWQSKAQAMAFEESINVRLSHFSYELKNNNLRLYPIPQRLHPSKMWVEFTVQKDAWQESSNGDEGISGINNLNTMPVGNLPYKNINSIGKQWIRRFALSLCKEMLGQIRSKFGSIPIPGESVTLNGADLITQAKEEQEKLREELKTTLDELTYAKLTETDAAEMESANNIMKKIPTSQIFMG